MMASPRRHLPLPRPSRPAGDGTPLELPPEELSFDKLIGSGAFGEVWLGKRISTGHVVAIKKLHTSKMSEKTKELYDREIATLASVSHRFILPFIGYTKDAPFCIVTEYIVNDSLFSALHSEAPKVTLTPTDLSVIAYGIANGMAFLHTKNLVHRDLKPQNILLNEDILPVICDFGSARSVVEAEGALTSTGGTSNYMAPEFIKGEKYDEKVDVYSYGMMLYEMLLRETPFDDLTGPQVICAVVIENKRPPLPSDAPEALRDLICACWDVDPEMRPSFQEISEGWVNRKYEFEGTNGELFTERITPKTFRKKSPPSFPRAGARTIGRTGSASGLLLSRQGKSDLFSSFQRLNVKGSVANNSLIKTHLDNLQDGSNAQKLTSLRYLEANIEREYKPECHAWQRLMPLFVNGQMEQVQEFRRLIEKMCKNSEILRGIASVRDLHVYLRPESLDVFLYIVSFHLELITPAVVERLIMLTEFGHENRSLILLCKIAEQAYDVAVVEPIYRFFKEKATSYSGKEKGDLILRILINRREANDEMIAAFLLSEIPENIVAGYIGLYVCGSSPNLLKMPTLLVHLCSESADVREEALRFVRDYAVELEGEYLIVVIEALLKVISQYSSEKAILLLCRYASDANRARAFITRASKDLFIQGTKQTMVGLLKIILVLFSHEELRPMLFSLPNFASFLGLGLRTEVAEAIMIVCDIIIRGDLPRNVILALRDAEVIDFIGAHMRRSNNTEVLKYLIAALCKMSTYGYLSIFSDAAVRMLELIEYRSECTHSCLAGLAKLSMRPEVCASLKSTKIATILGDMGNDSEIQPYLVRIYTNLRSC